jgi:hypothetical protein
MVMSLTEKLVRMVRVSSPVFYPNLPGYRSPAWSR